MSGNPTDEEPDTSDSDDNRHVEQIWTEYKLVQDKIDKIGDFKFRVKGWCVTLEPVMHFNESWQ
jgi:hypothetical protein